MALSLYAQVQPSGTLPILHIDTEGSAPVVDKETKIPAGLWVEIPENCQDKDFEAGSQSKPLEITIKGRGNSSWLKPKKPYKIKFEKKTVFLGMPVQKHFALLDGAANNGLSQVTGMELARLAGLGWAPRIVPVELVLNGEYLGLYNVAESIKIDPARLDIYEQPDENEDDETVPYGWLVEIDNYDDPCQIQIPRPDKNLMKVTYHTPEVLSDKQERWLYEQFNRIDDIIFDESQTVRETWAEIIDAPSLARLFIVNEVLGDRDGFNGSFYMYRDLAEDAKWHAGPMWDPLIECSVKPTDWLMNRLPDWSLWKIIPEVFYTKAFYEAFRNEWEQFYSVLPEMHDYMKGYAASVSVAAIADKKRWPSTTLITTSDAANKYQWLKRSADWINEHKGYYDKFTDGFPEPPSASMSSSVEIYTVDGLKITSITQAGIYIVRTVLPDGTSTVYKKLHK